MPTLLNTLLLAGSALALPASLSSRATEETCTKKSTAAYEWTVDDFDFHASYTFSTPAHQNSWGYVNFTLTNSVLDYKPICSASSSQLEDFFYGTMVYDCKVPENAEEATFTYSRPSGALQINQTWTCEDEGSRFTGSGGTKLDLDCKETEWQNPHWEEGQVYSTRLIDCTPVTVDAPIKTMTAIL